MAKMSFSDVGLRGLSPPPKGQISYWDDKLPSFGFRVSQGGTKTFVLNRKNSLITIGRFPTISLSRPVPKPSGFLQSSLSAKSGPKALPTHKLSRSSLRRRRRRGVAAPSLPIRGCSTASLFQDNLAKSRTRKCSANSLNSKPKALTITTSSPSPSFLIGAASAAISLTILRSDCPLTAALPVLAYSPIMSSN